MLARGKLEDVELLPLKQRLQRVLLRARRSKTRHLLTTVPLVEILVDELSQIRKVKGGTAGSWKLRNANNSAKWHVKLLYMSNQIPRSLESNKNQRPRKRLWHSKCFRKLCSVGSNGD